MIFFRRRRRGVLNRRRETRKGKGGIEPFSSLSLPFALEGYLSFLQGQRRRRRALLSLWNREEMPFAFLLSEMETFPPSLTTRQWIFTARLPSPPAPSLQGHSDPLLSSGDESSFSEGSGGDFSPTSVICLLAWRRPWPPAKKALVAKEEIWPEKNFAKKAIP